LSCAETAPAPTTTAPASNPTRTLFIVLFSLHSRLCSDSAILALGINGIEKREKSIKVNQLLGKFREKQMHIAIVINEHGIVTGLVTLEDIIEEIVGEISDEHEPTMGKIMPLQKDEWIVDASIALEDLGDFLGITFEAEGSVSLAGFLAESLHHIPEKDEEITYKKFIFQVHKATPLRVQFVRVVKVE
jgi:CBS domain containing-hemolysin-like protein